ncbi:hypothetical protein GCM10012284_08600 [Mangrovihabitans endophyticus]|uniref:Uncharacterized protein n=1 Tax=Mangrovihabitans endophyticus TaxID=1751298 RepID=A0A8J3FM62_9ACTN|nr:hypothetical protein GCM10012284_08600 [Mangrovihabitans endophyticus]
MKRRRTRLPDLPGSGRALSSSPRIACPAWDASMISTAATQGDVDPEDMRVPTKCSAPAEGMGDPLSGA